MVSKAPNKGLVDNGLEDKHKVYKMLSWYVQRRKTIWLMGKKGSELDLNMTRYIN